jgi:glycosyltransferase involved in cell wall biosynthesis
MFNYQTYPSDRRHLIIYDDSPKSNELLIKNRDNNITYIYDSDKKKLGYKRNKLNELAINMKAEYIMCLDDDDYYPSKKISYTITRMQATKA